jgi:gliding motility-associated-like protein
MAATLYKSINILPEKAGQSPGTDRGLAGSFHAQMLLICLHNHYRNMRVACFALLSLFFLLTIAPVKAQDCSALGIISNDTSVCPGTQVQLNARPALLYSWYPASGISNTSIQNPVLTVANAGTYYLLSREYSQNLAVNGDFEQGNTGFLSTYTYCNTANCLYSQADNAYAVGTNSNFFHSGFQGVDHTTGNGKFMIINGADPSLVVWRQSIPVKPNSDYAFGVWISTLIAYNTAQIRFSINGVQLGPIYNAPAAVNIWDRVFTTWNSGPNNTAVIEIVDVFNQAGGNDFGLDDIFFAELLSCVDSIAIGIPALPSVSIAASPPAVCAGAPVNFTATTANAVSGPVYQWQLNGSNVGQNSPSYTNSTLNNGDSIKCIITSDGVCVANVTAVSNGLAMRVIPLVTPAVTVAGPDYAPCAGVPVNFFAIVINAGTNPVYQWQLNGINVGTGKPVYTSSTLNNGDIIKCIITGNALCATSNTAVSNSFTIKITPLVTPGISITVPETIICAGTAVPFTATVTNAGSSPVYQWQLNGSNVGTNSAVYSSNALKNGDIVKCGITGSLSCSVSGSFSNNIVMNVLPLPVIGSAPDKTILNGEHVLLSLPVNGNVISYTWSPVAGLNNNTVQTPLASPSKTTIYTVAVTDTNGCTATGSITVKVLQKILVPNAFSPNADGINDTWHISNLPDYTGCTVDVFNRYGQRLFHSVGYNRPWDGTYNGQSLPFGTYYYIIDPKNGVSQLSGPITIIR